MIMMFNLPFGKDHLQLLSANKKNPTFAVSVNTMYLTNTLFERGLIECGVKPLKIFSAHQDKSRLAKSIGSSWGSMELLPLPVLRTNQEYFDLQERFKMAPLLLAIPPFHNITMNYF